MHNMHRMHRNIFGGLRLRLLSLARCDNFPAGSGRKLLTPRDTYWQRVANPDHILLAQMLSSICGGGLPPHTQERWALCPSSARNLCTTRTCRQCRASPESNTGASSAGTVCMKGGFIEQAGLLPLLIHKNLPG